jgi:hypothetical protein
VKSRERVFHWRPAAIASLLLSSWACGGIAILRSSDGGGGEEHGGADGGRLDESASHDDGSPMSFDGSETSSHDALPREGAAHDAEAKDQGPDCTADDAPEGIPTALGTAATCPDGGASQAFLVATSGTLYSFDVASAVTVPLGALTCPATAGASPFRMAVSGEGVVYVLYSDGNLFAVDPTTLVCTTTPFVKNQLGLPNDVAIAIAPAGGAERFFVYGLHTSSRVCELFPSYLAVADLTTFVLSEVGRVPPNAPIDYPRQLVATPGDGCSCATRPARLYSSTSRPLRSWASTTRASRHPPGTACCLTATRSTSSRGPRERFNSTISRPKRPSLLGRSARKSLRRRPPRASHDQPF